MITTRLLNYLNHEDRDEINHVICAYLKDHMEELPSLNIEEVARNCHVSIGKMSGFIRRLGYENWIAFKDDCRVELSQRSVVRTALKPAHPDPHLNFTVMEIDLTAVNRRRLEQFCTDIQNARNIFCFGSGYGRLLGEYLQMELSLINKPVILMDEQHIGSYEIHHEDLLVVFEEPYDFTETHPRLKQILRNYAGTKWILTSGYSSSDEHASVLSVGTRDEDLYLLRLEQMALLQNILRFLIVQQNK